MAELGYIVIVTSTTGYATPHLLTAPSPDVAIERVLAERKAKGMPFTGGQIAAFVVDNRMLDGARVTCEHVVHLESGNCTRCGDQVAPPQRVEPTAQQIRIGIHLPEKMRCRAVWRAGLSPRWGSPDDGARCILPIGHNGEHIVERASASPGKETPK